MGAYGRITESFRTEYRERSPIYRARMALWRKQPVVARVDKPTNIARARELGYKAKQGVIVARARVGRGRRKRPKPDLGRKPTKSGRFFSPSKSLQRQAEEKASAHFTNCEAIGSYWVGQDGENKFFEIILVDRAHPAIMSDRQLSGMASQRGRAFRGLTAAGKKGRGLTVKGIGAEKLRPSLRAWNKKGK